MKKSPVYTFSNSGELIKVAFTEETKMQAAKSKDSDSEVHRRIESAVQNLADKFLREGYCVHSKDARALAELEVGRAGVDIFTHQTLTGDQAGSRSEQWHEKREEIAERVEKLMQANPKEDYYQAACEAEKTVLR